jgi:hypothetical protein
MSCNGCIRQVTHGAAGLAKVGLQAVGISIDRAGDDLVGRRRDICRDCPHATRNAASRFVAAKGLTSLSRCTQCSCVIAAKTRIASEQCPVGKW